MQLTCATLGAFAKYPRSSLASAQGKFGYFEADAEAFASLAKELGLAARGGHEWARHPLVYLAEAADDICYRIVDLEDGYRAGQVGYPECESLLSSIAFSAPPRSFLQIRTDAGRLEYLRATAISRLAQAVADEFKEHEGRLVDGSWTGSLVGSSAFGEQMKAIQQVSKLKVYAARQTLLNEAGGYAIVYGLLGWVVPALMGGGSAIEKKMLQLLPEQFRDGANPYERLLRAADFVAGMTDRFAGRLYRQLSGQIL
jgi:dGTPase